MTKAHDTGDEVAATSEGDGGMPSPLLLNTALATIGGEAWIGETAAGGRPLVVALHGGGFAKEYFTGPYSLPDAAAAHGADTILLDRPGANASRFHDRRGDILSDNAAALDEAVTEIWARYGRNRPGVFLVGHSIGGAIALILAARRPAWPLLGVAVSGIGDRPPVGGPVPNDQAASAMQPPLPRALLAQLMLAPGAANGAALDALEAATVPVVTDELTAIYTIWPATIERVLPTIAPPVQIVLSEFEPLWTVDGEALTRLRGLLGAPEAEVGRWPDVGHCIDYHAQARSFHDAVFTFMKKCQKRRGYD